MVNLKKVRTKKPNSRKKIKEVTLHIFSDATGSLARHILDSVLSQFPGIEAQLVLHVFQGKTPEIKRALKEIDPESSLVAYAFVSEKPRKAIVKVCEKLGIPCHDLTGPTAEFIQRETGVKPVIKVKNVHRTDEEYFQKMKALEYTLQHDDSRRIESIDEADLVIVGLSRVSKTPTSTYLGSLGYKVANVSFVPDHGLPEELKKVRGKIIAFTCSPERLWEIRSRRFQNFKSKIRSSGLDDLPYYSQRATAKEVLEAESVYLTQRFPMLDITGLTVEEIAARVLKTLGVEGQRVSYA